MRIRWMALTAVALLSALPTSAQELRGEIGLQGGGLFFEGDSPFNEDFVYGVRVGYDISAIHAIEASVLFGETEVETTDRPSVDIFLPTLEWQRRWGNSGGIRPYIAIGAGLFNANPARTTGRESSDLAALYGAGLAMPLSNHWLLRVDGRHIINTEIGAGTNMGLASVGLSYVFGESAAPQTKEPVVAAAKPTDSDNDGVPDEKDACPGTKPGARVNAKGCVDDMDQDGVADQSDQCPDTTLGTVVDDRGCPKDADQDNVTDDQDECPGTPPGVAVDAVGCPQGAKAMPEKEWVLQGVQFETNSDRLAADGRSSLDEAGEILLTRTRVRVEIQGYSDNVGKPAYNEKLSERRAQSVKNYLMGKGVDESRMDVKGYGEAKPIADNATPEGRAKNRRIEFKVLSR